MDPLDTMTAADWRRVYEGSQEYAVSLLKQGVALRRREAELVDRLRRREARVTAAMELHQPYVVTDNPMDLCRTCDTIYPCATKIALEGEQ